MGLNKNALEKHCATILKSPRIQEQVVILCEGDIQGFEDRRSPQLYRSMEKMPDSNFYKACIPAAWRRHLPRFFNCGDRKDVLDSYFLLLEMHEHSVSESFLSPEKLFAIVDLDLQPHGFDNYFFPDTEEIHRNLYDKTTVAENNLRNQRIFVTGLIHKEAYFLVPDLQTVFDDFCISVSYDNESSVTLESVWMDMADAITADGDLKANFQRASERINFCTQLNLKDLVGLKESWKKEFAASISPQTKEELVFALLMITKAKGHWNRLHPPKEEWTGSVVNFREQLILAIGKFYSANHDNRKFHIPFLLGRLHSYFYG